MGYSLLEYPINFSIITAAVPVVIFVQKNPKAEALGFS